MKILTGLICFGLAFSLCACGSPPKPTVPGASGKIPVNVNNPILNPRPVPIEYFVHTRGGGNNRD
jgi:hypothetical protein